MFKKLLKFSVAVCTFGAAFSAQAAWPDRPIKLIVPYPPGNSSDVVARVVGEKLSEKLGQPVVVENRAGASGTLGTNFAAKQPADGYTLLIGAPGPLSVGPWTKTVPIHYDPVKDFVAVGALVWAPQILVVRQDLPVKNFKEFTEYAKKSDNRLQFGSAGVGTVPHLVMSQMLHQTGIKADHVPYKGGSQALADLRGGHIDFNSDTAPVVQAFITEGSIKALGVSTSERIPSLPNVPTLKEQGLTDFDLQGYILLVAPAKIPEDIASRLRIVSEEIMQDADVRKRLNSLGLLPMNVSRDNLAVFLKEQSAKWKKVVEISGAGKSQ